MSEQWQSNKESFEVTDVRELRGNFLPMIIKKANNVAIGDGICVVQSFEPVPLYSALADLGFEHTTEKEEEEKLKINDKPFIGISAFIIVLFTMPLGHAVMILIEKVFGHSYQFPGATVLGIVGAILQL